MQIFRAASRLRQREHGTTTLGKHIASSGLYPISLVSKKVK